MSAERMPDLVFEFLEDGTLRLEQDSGCGETVLVDLHPAQLRVLCERAGLVKPIPVDLADRLTEAHLRRLRGLVGRIEELHNAEAFFNDLFDRCANAVEWWSHIRAIFEMSQDLVADLGDHEPEQAHLGKVDAQDAPGQAELALGAGGAAVPPADGGAQS